MRVVRKPAAQAPAVGTTAAGVAPSGEGRRPACGDAEEPEVFYPDRSDPATAALAICAGCGVVRECASYALTSRERHGVWGGMTERDRELWWARQSRRSTVAKRRGA